MTDNGDSLPDDELAALLRRVGEDVALTPKNRDRARSEMLAEFDAIVGGAETDHSEATPSAVRVLEFNEQDDRPSTRSPLIWWSTAAAATLLVLTIVLVANLRTNQATSGTPDTTVPRTFATLPDVEEPARPLTTASPPILLEGVTYRTDEIRDGVEFAGVEGLQLVELRPGLIVLESVSNDGGVRARVSIFEAEASLVAGAIDNAVENGDVQVTSAQFNGADQTLQRQDLTITSKGVTDLDCVAQNGCLPLVEATDEFDPSVWARSENFLLEVSSGEPSVFVFVQTKSFGDPVLNQAFEIIDSLGFD